MRIRFSILFLTAFFFLSTGTPLLSQPNQYNPSRLFSVQELKEDFLFYKNKLEKIHSGLYNYTSKEELNSFFDSLSSLVIAPMTEMQFYNILTLVNSKIKDGHTQLLPSGRATDYFTSSAKFLPLTLFSSDDKLLVTMNCSSDNSIHAGDEITAINGTSAAEIMKQLLTRQIRDGNNQTYPRWILNTYFRSYYGFTFGHPEKFEISLANGRTVFISALSNDSIGFYKGQKYPGLLSVSKDQQGITLNTVDNISTALLTIKDLHNDVLKDTYHQSCKKTFAAYFKSFKESKTKNLVIDLRDNQGGDIENGEELLSYLLDNPFNILEKGPTSGIINPKENAFSGKVFVLINGGSFSNSGIISSYLQKVKRAVFIGEEAGGNRAVLNGNPKTGILPNTKIYYEIPSAVYLMRTDIKNDGHGTFPDYEIHSSAEDIIAKKDKVKEFALSLIQKN